MGEERFPKVNIRKNINGSWNQINANENITVPTSNPYVVQLLEVPDNGSEKDRPTITGLTETTTYPPGDGEFYVNYGTGEIEFHANQAGNNYTVNYWKKGSLIDADDINYLHELILETYADTTAVYDYEVIISDFSSFSGILSASDTDLKKALLTIDTHQHNFGLKFVGDVEGFENAVFTDTTGIINLSIPSLDWSKLTSIPSPTITLSGAASGNVTLVELSNGTLNVTISHRDLSDLLNDDHAQYALLNGRISQNLHLTTLTAESVSGITINDKDNNLIAYFDDTNNAVGVGSNDFSTAFSGVKLGIYKNGSDPTIVKTIQDGSGTSAYASYQLHTINETNHFWFLSHHIDRIISRCGVTLGGFNEIYCGGSGNVGLLISTQTACPIIIGTNNSERMRITENGNVGINSTSFGTSAAKVISIGSGTAPTTSPADAVQLWCADQGGTAGKAGLHIRTETGTSHVLSDYVGLGTTSPQQMLDVYGNIVLGGSNKTAASLQINALGTSGIAYIDLAVAGGDPDYDARIIRETGASGNLIVYNKTGSIKLIPNSVANAMVVNSSGYLGIGTDTPIEKLHVYDGNIRCDRGTTTSGLTRKITITGARNVVNSGYALIDMQNYDSGSATTYTGAYISCYDYGSLGNSLIRIKTSRSFSLLPNSYLIYNGTCVINQFEDSSTAASNWPPTATNTYTQTSYTGLQLLNGSGAAELTSIQFVNYNTSDGYNYNSGVLGLIRESSGRASFSFVLRNLGSISEPLRLYYNGNIGINTTSFGTSAAKVISIGSGTAPTTSPADAVQLWCADQNGTAGKAGLHIRAETGTSHVLSDYVGIGHVSPTQMLDVYGNVVVGGSDKTVANIQINALGTAGIAFIDMSVAGGNADYDFRIIRNTGASGNANIINRSTGTITINPNNVTNAFVFNSSGNLGIGTASFGTSAAKVLAIISGTVPTSCPADTTQLFSKDADGVAGKACLHVINECGTTPLVVAAVEIKSTTGDSSEVYEGKLQINTADNTVKIYAEGAWRSIASW